MKNKISILEIKKFIKKNKFGINKKEIEISILEIKNFLKKKVL